MSWVLILTSSLVQRPPAVIGGYLTREEAENAGDLSTIYDKDGPQSPEFTRYTVIPGAACVGPVGATHCLVERDFDFQTRTMKQTRHVFRT